MIDITSNVKGHNSYNRSVKSIIVAFFVTVIYSVVLPRAFSLTAASRLLETVLVDYVIPGLSRHNQKYQDIIMAFLSFRQLAEFTSSSIAITFSQLKRGNKTAESMNHKLKYALATAAITS